ncbi:MAG: hypothetical protein J5653_04020 [Clostridiales bacterium]|nr:hypothetical protein [Clostridiales bacterium]
MKKIMITIKDETFDILDAKAAEKKMTAPVLGSEIIETVCSTFTPTNSSTPCTQQIINDTIDAIRDYVKTLAPGDSFVLCNVQSYTDLPHGHKITVGKVWNQLISSGKEANVQRAMNRNGNYKNRGSAAVYTRI